MEIAPEERKRTRKEDVKFGPFRRVRATRLRMPKLRVFARRALCAVSVFGGGLFLTYGCGTDAVGVDACRQIEEARCDAAPACTGDDDTFGIRTEEQVRNCKALYRDQ